MILNLQTSETKLKRETMTQMSCKMQRVFSGAWASSCDALPRFISLLSTSAIITCFCYIHIHDNRNVYFPPKYAGQSNSYNNGFIINPL